MLLSRKAQAALSAAILFFVLSSPLTYRLVDVLVGGIVSALLPSLAPLFKIASNGCPTTYGLVLHAVVFGIVAYGLMSLQ